MRKKLLSPFGFPFLRGHTDNESDEDRDVPGARGMGLACLDSASGAAP